MTNPDHSTHASETCLMVLCVLVTLGLLAGTIWMLVGAYQP